MKKIILTKGLPASGKSTWALDLVSKNPNQYKRINKDDMRSMLDNGHWSRGNEKFVLQLRDIMVRKALEEGKHVIVDDTNLHSKHEKAMKEIARQVGDVEVIIKDFTNVPVKTCIERDLKRLNSVGKEVIMSMYNKFIRSEDDIDYEFNEDWADTAYLFDIDGTIALKGKRSPYDWNKVKEDSVNKPVAYLLRELKERGHKILLMSGRDGSCQNLTEEWLEENNIPYDLLLMREAGNQEKDSIIKKRMYETSIKDEYNVLSVFDDRDQVVDMWRKELGLPCFQVNYGSF